MKKLCINLLLVLGINFSVFGSDSERQLIYEAECAKFEDPQKDQSVINRVVFDRSTRRFAFEGSRENLDEAWFVKGQRVPKDELEKFDQNCLKQPGVTSCYFNMSKFAVKPANSGEQTLGSETRAMVVIILHTKYILDPEDQHYKARCAEAEAYAQRVDQYNALTKKERIKQIQQHLKRKKRHGQTATTSTTGAHNESTFSKV